jgi:hypothetical protein
MTTQELWQLQALEAPCVSAAYMRHLASDLALRTRIRRDSSYAIGVLGVLYLAWYSWRHLQHRPVMVAGLTLTMLALIYMAFRRRRLAFAAQVPEDAGALDSWSFYRLELERQRDALRGHWRSWIPPVAPGLLTVLAAFILELDPIPWALVAVETILIISGLSLGVALEEWSARRLQREIEALDLLVVKDPARG